MQVSSLFSWVVTARCLRDIQFCADREERCGLPQHVVQSHAAVHSFHRWVILSSIRMLLSGCSLFVTLRFTGVYLTTLTFIQDGMKDVLAKEGNLINFLKRAKASAIITEIKKYQASPYNLLPVEVMRNFLEESLKVDRPQDFYWELSLQREPRERDDEKMARLLQESGFL